MPIDLFKIHTIGLHVTEEWPVTDIGQLLATKGTGATAFPSPAPPSQEPPGLFP